MGVLGSYGYVLRSYGCVLGSYGCVCWELWVCDGELRVREGWGSYGHLLRSNACVCVCVRGRFQYSIVKLKLVLPTTKSVLVLILLIQEILVNAPTMLYRVALPITPASPSACPSSCLRVCSIRRHFESEVRQPDIAVPETRSELFAIIDRLN